MRIGLISDTHMRYEESDTALLPAIFDAFSGVDCILHAGDIYALWVLDRLEEIAPVYGVQAYPDLPDRRLAFRKQVLNLGGLRVGLVHNLGFPETGIDTDHVDRGLTFPPALGVQGALNKFFGENLDVVVFGDTHEEFVGTYDGVLFVNPGSPTYPGIKHELNSPGTVALLEINGSQAEARVVQLPEPATK